MGDGLPQIVSLFGQEFFRLVFIAFVIATPVVWFLMRDWLQDFEFSISLDFWTFAQTVGSSLLIAVGTVGYQGIRAALMNTAVSLKAD